MLQLIKNYLKITWDDEDSDITSLIERGKKYLSSMTGTTLTFEEDDLPTQLLFDYCRYARNNALEFFKENFADDILFLSLQEGVKAMEVAASESV
jgi:hypothetical protein